MKNLCFLFCFFLLSAFLSCNPVEKEAAEQLSISYEQYQLSNGLDVILHQDKSDPIVAVAIQYHVGSNREVPGKTGFAHLFEHMMFQQSENVGQDEFFRKIQGTGGTLNGGTSNDGTVYYEVVPKNALEMVLWLESDRMGFLQNTVTQSAFANQQNVVQNEKRQMVDNRPYGHNSWVIAKNLYPEGHPYGWTVIGEMEDLQNATVEDVKEFHSTFYVPNNATITIAGDFNPEEVKEMVEKYFGEIPGGDELKDPEPYHTSLEAPKKLYHEDNFARTPQLTMVWPATEEFSEDAYPLNFLAQILGRGKTSPFYRVIVKDKKLAPRAGVYNRAMELTGQFTVSINANAGISLAEVENAVFEAFKLFEEEGITEKDLEKHKASLETGFYNGISSVLGKSFQLARYNEYAGSPGYIEQDIEKIKAVTIPDIQRVYEKYIKGKPYLATSFVPKGQLELIAENSVEAGVIEEDIENATQVQQTFPEEDEVIAKTSSAFDRSVQPEIGPDPKVTLPEVWKEQTSNGMEVWGIKHSEVPLVRYSMVINGGHLLENPEKSGVSSFLASMMMEGTANKTPEELEEEIDMLGATIYISGSTENITINVNTLARNFEKTVELVEEILLEPRWDTEQFDLVKSRILNELKRNEANPTYLASLQFSKLIYGENSILGIPSTGTIESVESITMDDLKAFYAGNISPAVTEMQVAGDIEPTRVMNALSSLSAGWEAKEVEFPEISTPQMPEKGGLYFLDIPGAKQSNIFVGYAALPREHEDYFPATVMNYKLGGSFNGILNLILREEKGFTYGARSGFAGYQNHGNFTANSSVRSDATLESVNIFKTEIEKYCAGISEEDLQFTKDALMKSYALKYETLGALLSMLRDISEYDLPNNYPVQEVGFIKNYNAAQHLQLAKEYLQTEKMIFVVAGDAKTQMNSLESVGLGKPILIEN
ncbi:MAG: insulinase family protein [Mariniphaga sp.]|nr:insulinase family protein [Mariniphaga sp.]